MKVTKTALNNPAIVAKMLQEYQDWRKGIGIYAWDEDPSKNAPMPFSSIELSQIEVAAIRHLNCLAGQKK